MSYDGAILELRQLLADTDFNKKASNKKLLGDINGENVNFITYDKRISEDTIEVTITQADGEVIIPSVTVDDAIKGTITLSEAPALNSSVTANYYWRWWLDEELINFLNKGAETVSQTSILVPDEAYLQIPPGLKLAALDVAVSLANSAQIQYMINRRHSEEFLLEQDGNDDANFSNTISAMSGIVDAKLKSGLMLRDDFYKRQGKRFAPAFAIKLGVGKRYGPQR